MGMRLLASIAIVAAIGFFSHKFLIKHKATVAMDESEPAEQNTRASSSKNNRRPASVGRSARAQVEPRAESQVTASRANALAFKQNADVPASAGHQQTLEADSGNNSETTRKRSAASSKNRTHDNDSDASSPAAKTSSSNPLSNAATTSISNVNPATVMASGQSNGSGSSSSNGSGSSSTTTTTTSSSNNLSCTASVGGGVFSNPINVSLSCSASASIKYCVRNGSCCDPETEGADYSSTIVVGSTNGHFCLSFYGETSSSKLSSVSQVSYTISNSNPDLQVSLPKIFYQTTQLEGLHYLRSSDFAKSNFSIGEVNLKTHDPGPSGLNMSCDDIIQNYVTLPAPAPVAMFATLDMSGISVGDQLNVPMPLSKLDYGENFITSYAVNDNIVPGLTSCSTNKITLEDFEFFDLEIAHGDDGTNTVREFSGSFVPYGFFEAPAQLNRTPAGSSTEDESGQELRTGSFGIFY